MIVNTLGISYKWNHTVFMCLFISLSIMSSRLSRTVACDTTVFFFFLFLLRVNNISLCFPGGSVVKNLPAKQETWIQSLRWEDNLEKEIATHSSIFAWEIPWTEEPGRLQSMDSRRVRCDLVTKQQQKYFIVCVCHLLFIQLSHYKMI